MQTKLFKAAIAACATGAFAFTGAAFAAVTADPASITIVMPGQHVQIALTNAGKPVGASAVKGYMLHTDGHNYAHMLKLEKRDGGVTISPSDSAQIGTYDLEITTAYGAAHVALDMPLNESPDSIQNRAKAEGITVDELLLKLGVAKTVGRETVTFSAPGPYRAGDVFKLDSPCPANRDYEWSVNGKVVKQGHGTEGLEFTFPSAGNYEISYRDSEDGKPKATGAVTVTVGAKQ